MIEAEQVERRPPSRGSARLGLAEDEALRMASTYPADFLGLADQYGRIAPGAAPDLIVPDEALAVRETWVAGARVFGPEGPA